MHRDLCFGYDVKIAKQPELPPWFSRLEFVDIRKLTSGEFGSAQVDLARKLRLVPK